MSETAAPPELLFYVGRILNEEPASITIRLPESPEPGTRVFVLRPPDARPGPVAVVTRGGDTFGGQGGTGLTSLTLPVQGCRFEYCRIQAGERGSETRGVWYRLADDCDHAGRSMPGMITGPADWAARRRFLRRRLTECAAGSLVFAGLLAWFTVTGKPVASDVIAGVWLAATLGGCVAWGTRLRRLPG